ncbi:MAG TPA: winged helix-turn-helix domain-containing protein, partial [Steroidobacteraceae bacterium]|nr:winged helix-turn-helix domain-containing protein [Steroidobacteraceae bacterium]
WTVNRVSGETIRADRRSRLPQQPLRILVELFDHAGEVVTRDQLVKALWPSGIVDFDNGLNVAMRKLRVALDDVGDEPRYIETLPKVGYRFVVNKGGETAVVADPPPRRGRPLLLGLVLLALVVALALGWWLSSSEPRSHVPSIQAQELYLEGLHHRSRRDIDGGMLAREKFEAAIHEDPAYAQAWAALGETISVAVIRQTLTPAEGIPKARAAAERAVALDDALAEGHFVLGQIHMDHDKDFAGAQREYERAMRLDSKSARLWHHYSMLQGQLGRIDDAFTSIRRARELEPMTLLYAGNHGLLLYEARRYGEAIDFLKPLVESNPRFDQARAALARAMMATGDLDGARAQLLARASPGFDRGDLGVLFVRLERRDDALRELAALEERARQGYGVAFDQATIYIALGDLDRGCEYLMRAVRDHSIMVNWMRLDPRLDPLRGRQCFADAEKKLYASM